MIRQLAVRKTKSRFLDPCANQLVPVEMNKTKRELKKEYQQHHPPMGIYQIRNTINGRVLIGRALNFGSLNGSKLQLRAGNHPNKALQDEWREFGGESFVFEILDELSPTEGPSHDYRAELEVLEEIWLDRLQPYGESGYNEKKKGTEEKLKLIARNRLLKEKQESRET